MSIIELIETGRGLTFGTRSYLNGGVYGALPPGFMTLLVVHRGAASVTYDGRQLVLVGGECGIIVNEQLAHFTYQKHLRTEVSWCEARLGARKQDEAVSGRGVAPKLPISDRIKSILDMGLETGLESSTTRNELRDSLGRAIFAAYQFESSQSESAQNTSRGLLRVRTFIDEHFSEDITLLKLADVAAMTPNHLVSAFGRKFGTTPIRYLWKQRAAHAVRLLVHTAMTGSEIAYACGYKSPYHFSRSIRLSYGSTPTEIRKQKGFIAPSDIRENVQNVLF
ncbi:helix-turn-helix domain-containing protein [Zavarzinia aquatilis]|uniref:HTH araC/xylS-type domain-containing protein n=1 Tax=Zavarzinia aquatilis TaxID=2211142 RepID=A0A317EFD8_9PROT|nr:AraC family transcriptional regulator [Zavarzinia aquatilis]PWR25312.1 hypothetical protein DKG74_06005 [Zavarzinia aquatilis]